MEPAGDPCRWPWMIEEMSAPAPLLTLTGRLVRRDGAFILQCDNGDTWELRLARVPVDHVGKSVAVTGRRIAPGIFDADGVRAA